MIKQTLSLSRIFSRGKRSSGKSSERVEAMPMQERSFRISPTEVQEDQSNGAVLTEAACAGCQHASAGATVFVP